MASSKAYLDLILDRTILSDDIDISLHTADPGDAGANEVEGGGYRRQPITFGKVRPGTATNNVELNFEAMPEARVTHFGLWRSDTFWLGGPLITERQVFRGDTAQWLTAELVIRMW